MRSEKSLRCELRRERLASYELPNQGSVKPWSLEVRLAWGRVFAYLWRRWRIFLKPRGSIWPKFLEELRIWGVG